MRMCAGRWWISFFTKMLCTKAPLKDKHTRNKNEEKRKVRTYYRIRNKEQKRTKKQKKKHTTQTSKSNYTI